MIAVLVEVGCIITDIIDLWLTGLIQFQWQDAKKNPLMSPVEQKRVILHVL